MIGSENNYNLDRYKDLINKFNKLDIITKELTLFDIGTRGHFENPNTELLSFFLDLNKPHKLENCFFDGLQDLLANKNITTIFGDLMSVETEVSTAKGNRIDLLLETEEVLIIVECKIYHEQNNPFDDYTSYGKRRIENSKNGNEKQKDLVKLVLCLNGRIDDVIKNNCWHGISYQELVEAIELHLSKALLDNPYNKWGLFAREFLLHLKELDNMGEISKDEINFLKQNLKAFTDLNAYIYDNLMPKIGEKIRTDLNKSNLENFVCKEKSGKWKSYEPIRRFSNTNWTTQSDVTLWIKTSDVAKSCQVRVYIDKQADVLVNKFKDSLSEPFLNTKKEEWYELKNVYWGIAWEFDDFDLEEISKIIINLMGYLNELELSHRHTVLK